MNAPVQARTACGDGGAPRNHGAKYRRRGVFRYGNLRRAPVGLCYAERLTPSASIARAHSLSGLRSPVFAAAIIRSAMTSRSTLDCPLWAQFTDHAVERFSHGFDVLGVKGCALEKRTYQHCPSPSSSPNEFKAPFAYEATAPCRGVA